MDCSLPGIFCLWGSPGKNSGGGCHFLLQAIFLTQESNPGFLHWQAASLPLSHQGSPERVEPGLIAHIILNFIYLFLWLCLKAFGMLVSLPGTEPVCPAVEVWSLNHWTTREVPRF